jgi:hypothetical protein
MRRFVSRPRALAVLAALALFACIGLPASLADSQTGSQDPRYSATSTLSPNVAQFGQVLTATGSVTNVGGSSVSVSIEVVITFPGGRTSQFVTTQSIPRGQTYTLTKSYTLTQGRFPAGKYTVMTMVSDPCDPCQHSTATATAYVK